MRNIDKVLDTFVNGDYFIIFLVVTLVILLVLVLALIKSREEYNELLNRENERNNSNDNNIIKTKIVEKEEPDIIEEFNIDKTPHEDDDMMGDFKSLMASSEEDKFDENKPLIKQINIDGIKTYDKIVEEYENIDEENAIISADELEAKARERMDNLGISENQEIIAKYEEEQEKKAIISYEQLLKNASNITLSYKEEKQKSKNAPKINKIEIEQKEVSGSEIYLEEEEFLKILKDFRVSIE